jgi:hypothetical protein
VVPLGGCLEWLCGCVCGWVSVPYLLEVELRVSSVFGMLSLLNLQNNWVSSVLLVTYNKFISLLESIFVVIIVVIFYFYLPGRGHGLDWVVEFVSGEDISALFGEGLLEVGVCGDDRPIALVLGDDHVFPLNRMTLE